MPDYLRHLVLSQLTSLTHDLAEHIDVVRCPDGRGTSSLPRAGAHGAVGPKTSAAARATGASAVQDRFPASAFRVDVLVNVLRDTASVQTHNHVLELLGTIATVHPDLVLNNIMAVFTFIGSTTVRQDDNYTFLVLEQVRRANQNRRGAESVEGALRRTGQSMLTVRVAVCRGGDAGGRAQTLTRVLPPLVASRKASVTTPAVHTDAVAMAVDRLDAGEMPGTWRCVAKCVQVVGACADGRPPWSGRAAGGGRMQWLRRWPRSLPTHCRTSHATAG